MPWPASTSVVIVDVVVVVIVDGDGDGDGDEVMRYGARREQRIDGMRSDARS